MTPTTKRLLIAGLAVAAIVIIGGVVAFLLMQSPSGTASVPGSVASAPSGPTPEPRILVIDRATILRQSAAGKDMIAQVDALTKAAEGEFRGEEQRLRGDASALQQQSAVLSPEVRAQRTRDINGRQQALQKKVQDRQNQIQAGVYKARKEIEDALAPILEQIMRERGANFLVDRNAVVLGTVDVDITAIAIQRLDQRISHVKVDLIDPATLGAQLQPSTATPAPPQ
jgi:Skp family chaperone for outer membrane proteins